MRRALGFPGDKERGGELVVVRSGWDGEDHGKPHAHGVLVTWKARTMTTGEGAYRFGPGGLGCEVALGRTVEGERQAAGVIS